MGWRGPTALVALVLLGVAAGYGASSALTSEQTRGGTAEPVVASGPVSPVPRSPGRSTRPEPAQPDDDPLQPDILLETATMGTGKFAISFLVPAGWTTNLNATNEAKWKQPGTSNNTYVMRVEQVLSQGLTIKEAMARRLAEFDAEPERQFDVVAQRRGSLEYTYVSDEGTRRHSFVRWLDVSGSGKAEVEVVVHGRPVDVPGTSDLIDRVARSMTPAAGPPS